MTFMPALSCFAENFRKVDGWVNEFPERRGKKWELFFQGKKDLVTKKDSTGKYFAEENFVKYHKNLGTFLDFLGGGFLKEYSDGIPRVNKDRFF